MSSYLSVSGVITRIQPLAGVNSSQYGCTLNMSIRSLQQGEVNFTVTGDTYVVDNTTLHPGDQVTVFYDGNAPAPLIYPPQYKAVVIALSAYHKYYLGEFYNNFVSTDGTLQLNGMAAQGTFLPNGQIFSGALVGKTALVEYTSSTRSIPAQTTPDRVIVFCYS